MMRVLADRHDAGAQLAGALHRYMEAPDGIVLAHTHVSVPVAYEVATRLALPLALVDDDDLDVADKLVLLIDDGDTGRYMPAAIEQLRASGARSIIAGIAVASPQVFAMLHAAADDVACLLTPQHLYSIEAWYADLGEPSEDEVRQLLVAAAQSLLVSRPRHIRSLRIDS
jgi:predicted phosphoribosyltransferase